MLQSKYYMKTNASLIYNVCLVMGDFLSLVAAFVAAYILRVKFDPRPLIEPIHALPYLGIFLTVLPFWILIFALFGLYNSNIYEKRFAEFGRLLIGSFIGLLFLVFWNFVSKTPIFPARLVPIYGFGLGFGFLLIFRNLLRYIRTKLFSYSIGLTKVILVGNTAVTNEIITTLSDPKTGYRIIGIVGTKHQTHHIPGYATFQDFLDSYNKQPFEFHGIIQTELFTNEARNAEILTYAQQNHIGYRFVPGNSELFVGNIEVELFRSSVPVIVVRQTAIFGWGRVYKRLFDLLFGGILLLLASPLILIIYIIEQFSGGQAIFHQKRLTRFDRKFDLFKFRTIYSEYNGLTPEEAFTKMGKPEFIKLYRDNGDQIAHDPRFTPLGRLLRKTSLDELPQLFNVIRGDISLVGPRPLIPQELSAYKKRHTILSAKSGLTGLAQISGRRDISFEERRKLDLYYVQNWSLWMDLVILVKTLRLVISGRGASS